MDLVQITTTTDSADAARKIADHLVDRRLAACVQVTGPLVSTYRWKGSVERTDEFICLIKTRRELSGAVEESIRSMHSYENPEIVVTAIEGGSPDYVAWIESETSAQVPRDLPSG